MREAALRFCLAFSVRCEYTARLALSRITSYNVCYTKLLRQTTRYTLRKNEVAKPNELAGVSGKIEGKFYLPYENGMAVKADESIVETIKDGWNVPNRIPYASEIQVKDGAPVTQKILAKESGVVKYYLLKGDYLERHLV